MKEARAKRPLKAVGGEPYEHGPSGVQVERSLNKFQQREPGVRNTSWVINANAYKGQIGNESHENKSSD